MQTKIRSGQLNIGTSSGEVVVADYVNGYIAAGTSDAITVTTVPNIPDSTDCTITVKVPGTNTTTTPTLQPSGWATAKNIVHQSGGSVQIGSLTSWHTFKYDTTLGAFVVLDPMSYLIQYVEEIRYTAVPNDVIPAHQLIAVGAETNIDFVLSPQGSGALLAQPPDNSITGGNKRGIRAVDLQMNRSAATQVASGGASGILSGSNNTASGDYSGVASGASNQATGIESFIGGGINNIVSGSIACVCGGSVNIASSTTSCVVGGSNNTAGGGIIAFVGGGSLNTASGSYAAIVGGSNNLASGTNSFVGGGDTNIASGQGSSVLGGAHNTASGSYGMATGLRSHTRGIYGRASFASGIFAADGDAQISTNVLRLQTTTATPGILDSAGSGTPTSTTVTVLPNNYVHLVTAHITARDTTTNDVVAWTIEGVAKRGVGVATTALVGTPVITKLASDAGASTWAVDLIVDSVLLGAVEIQVTGEAGKTINWLARVETVELG